MHRRGEEVSSYSRPSLAQLCKSANFVVTTSSSTISRAVGQRSHESIHVLSGHRPVVRANFHCSGVWAGAKGEDLRHFCRSPSGYPAAKVFRGEFFQCFGRFRRSILASTDQAALAGRLVYIQLAGRFPQVVPVSL